MSQRQRGEIDDHLLLLEHPPVITLGRASRSDFLKSTPEQLQASGVLLAHCGRGGEVTYHGPGQLVAYPILQLEDGRRDLHRYLRDLEEVGIRTCADWSVQVERRAGLTGLWWQGRKLASIGVRASRWVTSHGLALNYGEDLSGFDHIVPCGLSGVDMISLAPILGKIPERKKLEERFCHHFSQIFSRQLYPLEPPRYVATEHPQQELSPPESGRS